MQQDVCQAHNRKPAVPRMSGPPMLHHSRGAPRMTAADVQGRVTLQGPQPVYGCSRHTRQKPSPIHGLLQGICCRNGVNAAAGLHDPATGHGTPDGCPSKSVLFQMRCPGHATAALKIVADVHQDSVTRGGPIRDAGQELCGRRLSVTQGRWSRTRIFWPFRSLTHRPQYGFNACDKRGNNLLARCDKAVIDYSRIR